MTRTRAIFASFFFIVFVAVAWVAAHHSSRLTEINLPRAFAAIVLLFAPLWFFAFGAAEPLKKLPGWSKILLAAALSSPYFIFAAGTDHFYWRSAVIVFAFPVLLAGFLELPKLPAKMTLRDVIALGIIVAAYFERWLSVGWPPLAFFPKLFLADVALYCFLVIQKLEGSGYSLMPTRSDLRIGVRELAFYFPVALIVGELTGFIEFHPVLPSPGRVLQSVLFTFFLVALPEEMFFRSILQNFLETRIGGIGALLLASALFGLSHFNHGPVFNWRYVTLASIAGIFYGRAWRAERRVFASIVTHTAVDVIWALWFR